MNGYPAAIEQSDVYCHSVSVYLSPCLVVKSIKYSEFFFSTDCFIRISEKRADN